MLTPIASKNFNYVLVLTTVLADINGEVRIGNFTGLSFGVIQRKGRIYETLSGDNILADCGYFDDRRTITFSFTDYIAFNQLKVLLETHSEFDIYTPDGVFRGMIILTHSTDSYGFEMQTYQKLA